MWTLSVSLFPIILYYKFSSILGCRDLIIHTSFICLLIFWANLYCILVCVEYFARSWGQKNEQEKIENNAFLQGGDSLKEMRKTIQWTKQLQRNVLWLSFNESLLWVKYITGYFIHVVTNSHKSWAFLFPFDKWKIWGSKSINNTS